MKKVTSICVLSDSESSTGSNSDNKAVPAPVIVLKDSACSTISPPQLLPDRPPTTKRLRAATFFGVDGEHHDSMITQPPPPPLLTPPSRPTPGPASVLAPLRMMNSGANGIGIPLSRRIGMRYHPYIREREQQLHAARRDSTRRTLDLLSTMDRDNNRVVRSPRENDADRGTFAEWGASIRLGIDGADMELDLDLKL
ncbi:hypothetical protein VNO77_17218 [Canavalia gladiata]|uniref:Uncharacterized protein n=1 Tax=Canavalia gladiata TaxID=3824 RepID=A0AAN9LIK2_CANGL